jgi:hypothetical protein
MMLWVEGLTAAIIAAVIFVVSLFQLKPEHMAGDAVSVRIGAALQGLFYGGVVAFVMLPLRLQLMEGALSGEPAARPRLPAGGYNAWIGALALIWVIRGGVAARLPLIGHPFRAYRLASLRHAVSVAQARIARLEALDAPKQKTD